MRKATDLNRLAFHEAAHAVMARFFKDDLELFSITIQQGDIQGQQTEGLINIRAKGGFKIATSIVALAGMVGEYILDNGAAKAKESKQAILANPGDFLPSGLGGGDFSIFHREASIYWDNYAATETGFQQQCLGCVIDVLANKEVWSVVERLAQDVQLKEDLTLGIDELENIFSQTEVDEWTKHNKSAVLRAFREKTPEEMEQDRNNRMIPDDIDSDIFNMGPATRS